MVNLSNLIWITRIWPECIPLRKTQDFGTWSQNILGMQMMCTSTGGEAPNVIVGAQTLKLCAKALLRTMTFCIESVCPASAWFYLFALHTFYLVYILCMIFLAFVLHVFTFIYHQYHAHVYFLCPHFIIYSPKSYHDWCCIFVYGVTLNKTCLIVPLVWVIYVSTEGVWPSGTPSSSSCKIETACPFLLCVRVKIIQPITLTS